MTVHVLDEGSIAMFFKSPYLLEVLTEVLRDETCVGSV